MNKVIVYPDLGVQNCSAKGVLEECHVTYFLSKIEPKSIEEALNESYRIMATQEELVDPKPLYLNLSSVQLVDMLIEIGYDEDKPNTTKSKRKLFRCCGILFHTTSFVFFLAK